MSMANAPIWHGDTPIHDQLLEEYRPRHELVEHGRHLLFDAPTTFLGLKRYLEHFTGEGIVWWAGDGRQAKIKRSDFGWK